MEAKIAWLFAFALLYWAFCVFWGVKGAIASRTASDYFIAGRRLPFWLFMLAATATSFTGWAFIGHPALVYADGFPYAYAALGAVAIPLAGALFLKRQWMLGRRFGFVTPGEMLAYYFRSDAIRLLVVVVALAFAVPYLALQLRASGFLFHTLTDGLLGVEVGMWLLALVVFVYVASGGLRAVAHVDAVQGVLLALGIVGVGAVVLYYVGGWAPLTSHLAALAQTEGATAITPAGEPAYVAIPGVIQFVSDGPAAAGGAWTGVMILTFVVALMGIQAAPAFSTWAFASKDPRPFAPQQVWASALGVGLILLVFAAIQGVGGHFLGADLRFAGTHPERVSETAALRLQSNLVGTTYRDAIAAAGVSDPEIRAMVGQSLRVLGETGTVPTIAQLAELEGDGAATAARLAAGPVPVADRPALIDLARAPGGADALVPQLINLMGEVAPWLVGLLAVCALAALQSAGAVHVSAAGLITRDLVGRLLARNLDHGAQRLVGRISVGVIVLLALAVATATTDALVLLGGLAAAYGVQMAPALVAVCWWPWLTRQGVTLGLIAGLVAVTLTDGVGQTWLGIEAWGRWPLTIHAAGWGLFFNVAVAVLVSALTRDDMARKMEFHNFLGQHAALAEARRGLVPVAWIVAVAWFFFAVGPGAVIGNGVFGDPNAPGGWWLFGLPSIWAWQALWWLLGVAMLYFLAYTMRLSTVPEIEVEAVVDDVGELERARVRA